MLFLFCFSLFFQWFIRKKMFPCWIVESKVLLSFTHFYFFFKCTLTIAEGTFSFHLSKRSKMFYAPIHENKPQAGKFWLIVWRLFLLFSTPKPLARVVQTAYKTRINNSDEINTTSLKLSKFSQTKSNNFLSHFVSKKGD